MPDGNPRKQNFLDLLAVTKSQLGLLLFLIRVRVTELKYKVLLSVHLVIRTMATGPKAGPKLKRIRNSPSGFRSPPDEF